MSMGHPLTPPCVPGGGWAVLQRPPSPWRSPSPWRWPSPRLRVRRSTPAAPWQAALRLPPALADSSSGRLVIAGLAAPAPAPVAPAAPSSSTAPALPADTAIDPEFLKSLKVPTSPPTTAALIRRHGMSRLHTEAVWPPG